MTAAAQKFNTGYERLSDRQELRRLLDEGLAAAKAGQSRPAEDIFAELEQRFQLGEA